jgi:hypothetical protein
LHQVGINGATRHPPAKDRAESVWSESAGDPRQHLPTMEVRSSEPTRMEELSGFDDRSDWTAGADHQGRNDRPVFGRGG